MTNPLLDTLALPRFGEIRPEHIAPALDRVIGEIERNLDKENSIVTHDAGAPPVDELARFARLYAGAEPIDTCRSGSNTRSSTRSYADTMRTTE